MNFEGPIIMNGRAIGAWSIALVGPQITGTDRWSCMVRVHGDTTSAIIEHTYSDGIAILISKCLETHTESEARRLRVKQK